ncbi:hypothetical protein HPG69_016711 [Diceros bicornis minor]|uniref:EF-hand domain-containing protein n=1 Tax=Diceros bicornis minor TaxID=77932 RepID=A0A7J7FAL7_DICBM|nr:hypothetical protein HPG69_016711 [Diceros bicornis minor]
MAKQIKEYKGVFEMFNEEGNGAVKTGELRHLMSLLGINRTKSELVSMAKDVDRDREGAALGAALGGLPVHVSEEGLRPAHPHVGPCRCLLPADKGFFNCDSFPALMGIYSEKAQNQESKLRAAFCVFDKEGKGYVD